MFSSLCSAQSTIMKKKSGLPANKTNVTIPVTDHLILTTLLLRDGQSFTVRNFDEAVVGAMGKSRGEHMEILIRIGKRSLLQGFWCSLGWDQG